MLITKRVPLADVPFGSKFTLNGVTYTKKGVFATNVDGNCCMREDEQVEIRVQPSVSDFLPGSILKISHQGEVYVIIVDVGQYHVVYRNTDSNKQINVINYETGGVSNWINKTDFHILEIIKSTGIKENV